MTLRVRRKVTLRVRRKVTVIPQERAKRAPVGIYSALRRPLSTKYAKKIPTLATLVRDDRA